MAIDSNTLEPAADIAEEPGLSGPFCTGELETQLDTFLECLTSSPCVEEREGQTHLALEGTEALDCIARKCSGSFFALVPEGSDEQSVASKRCWMCSIVHLSGYESLQSVRELCTSDEQPFLAFRGTTGWWSCRSMQWEHLSSSFCLRPGGSVRRCGCLSTSTTVRSSTSTAQT